MKKTIILIILLVFCQSVWAVSLKKINDANMKIFLEIMPQYNAWLEKYSKADLVQYESYPYDEYNESLRLIFLKYNVSPSEFSAFLKRVAAGYAALSDPTVNISVGINELQVIEKYKNQLKGIFE